MQLSGFSYNSSHLNSKSFDAVVYHVARDYGPALSMEFGTMVNIPGYQGSYPLNQDLRPRVIEIRFHAFPAPGNSLREVEREVAQWLQTAKTALHQPEPKPIVFDDEDDKRYLGFPQAAVDVREEAQMAECQVSFICPVPYAEAVQWTINSGTSGVNNGSVPAVPIIYATVTEVGGITDLKIELDNSDKFLLLEGAFAQNEVIVFDASKRMVTVDGVDARGALHYNRRWFEIPPGSYSFTTTPSSGVDIEVHYRERWL